MTWYLGPVGRLVALPVDPDLGLDVSATPQQAIHRSLGGVATRDRLANKRSWPLSFDYLDHSQSAYLEAIDAGDISGTLRLLDPLRPNMLPPDAATGGVRSKTAASFAATGNGTIGFSAFTDPPAEVPASGGIAWTRPDTTAGTLQVARASENLRVPLVPSVPVTFRAWCRATVSTLLSLTIEAWSAATTSAGTAAAAAATAVGTSWVNLTVGYTPPASGQLTANPVLSIAAGQPAGTVTVTGLTAVQNVIDPGVWTPGGGAPVVISERFKDAYPVPLALHNAQLILLEV